MPKPFQTDITESPEFLAQLLEQEKDVKRYQKLRTLYLLKTGKVLALTQIAQIIGRHQSTVKYWVKTYRQGGLLELLKDGKDRFLDIPSWAVDRLVEKFQDAQFLPPIRDIQSWVMQELGVSIEYRHLQRLLRFKGLPVQQSRRVNQDRQLEKVSIEGVSDLKDLSGTYEKFSDWRDERGIPNDVQALNQLMGEFFGIRAVHAVSPLQQPGKTLIESLTQGLLVANIPYNIPDLLIQSRLAERLKVNVSILSCKRGRRTFPGWTRQRDPDGIGWLWVPELRKYRPLLSDEEIRAILLSPNEKSQCR